MTNKLRCKNCGKFLTKDEKGEKYCDNCEKEIYDYYNQGGY